MVSEVLGGHMDAVMEADWMQELGLMEEWAKTTNSMMELKA